jgi:hypothetical protein
VVVRQRASSTEDVIIFPADRVAFVHSSDEENLTAAEIDARVPRRAQWAPRQRPALRDGDSADERALTSPEFESITAASIPPAAADAAPAYGPLDAPELRSRLVVGIACGVHSGHIDVAASGGVSALPVLSVLLESFLHSAQPHLVYRFYFAFDAGDPVYDDRAWRAEIERYVAGRVVDEDARRWHPQSGGSGGQLDPSHLVITLHWVRNAYRGKPSWAHSDAAAAAFRAGADYVFR